MNGGASLRPPRRVALGLSCLALALGGLACGDDDSETTTPTTEPATLTGPTGPTSGSGPEQEQGQGGDVDLEDGTVTPPPEADPDDLPAPEDSPENDTPPPPGSPAEQFEKYCDENPEACG